VTGPDRSVRPTTVSRVVLTTRLVRGWKPVGAASSTYRGEFPGQSCMTMRTNHRPAVRVARPRARPRSESSSCGGCAPRPGVLRERSLDIPGAMITRAPTLPRPTGSSSARPARTVGHRTGSVRIKRLFAPGSAYDGARHPCPSRTCCPSTPSSLKTVDLSVIRPLTVSSRWQAWAATRSYLVSRSLPITTVPIYCRSIDGSFPNHEATLSPQEPSLPETGGQGAQAGRSPRLRRRTPDVLLRGRARLSVEPVRADRDDRGPASCPEPGETVIPPITSRGPLSDHRSRLSRPSDARPLVHQVKWRRPTPSCGGENSVHFYFRDFWSRRLWYLAALHTLAAFGHDDRRGRHPRRFAMYSASL